MSKLRKPTTRSKSAASDTLATLYCLRSMTSFIQAWIEEAIARIHSGDEAGAKNAISGLDVILAEMLQAYREITPANEETT
ncbi:MAG: hypothetical protein ACK4FK_03430 [Ferrovibrio sp.]|uniref:hypothetical protein n=1 Tax=Ferrovibrio sp. TaxID=1917215 RepID=UPI00391AF32E